MYHEVTGSSLVKVDIAGKIKNNILIFFQCFSSQVISLIQVVQHME